MNYKWVGAILIIGSCSGFGLTVAFNHLQEIHLLDALKRIMDNMLCELTFQLTPLPDLVRHSSVGSPEALRTVLYAFAENLDRQLLPDALCCMQSAIEDTRPSFQNVTEILNLLGHSLGRFDLQGQIKELSDVREKCARKLEKLESMRDSHLRIYRILGICAGISLTVFLI